MKKMILKDIINIVNGKAVVANKELICENFSKDTRTIEKGDIYIGIKGDNFDGNKFWEKALEAGADCVIIQDIEVSNEKIEKYYDKSIIIVEDTLEALYKIAKHKRELYNIPVVTITGSVGKTSTKDIISNVISQKYKTLKTIGNNNNNIGLPFTILRLKDEEVMVLEMGMNHLGEISLLSKIAKPDICIITNVGTSHIGNLGSRENILKAKMEILDGTENPKLIINTDNDMLNSWYKNNQNNKEVYTYSIKETSEHKINIKEMYTESTVIEYNENEITIPVSGEHFISNTLCAITVAKMLNIEETKIKKGIETFELTKNRMEIINIESKNIKIINDAYNASYESMKASLSTLKTYNKQRKIAILGDIFELGGFSKEYHRKVGEEIVLNEVDILICGGIHSKEIYLQAISDGMNSTNAYYYEDNKSIVQKILEIVTNGDIILIKASNGMKFNQITKEIIENVDKKD